MTFNIGQVNDKKEALGITRELLLDQYWSRSQSTQEIADGFGTTRATVSRWLRYFDVPIRRKANFASKIVPEEATTITGVTKLATTKSPLTDFQKSVLRGTLCGDGCLKASSVAKAYLSLHHGWKQSDYLIHKANVFAPLVQRICGYGDSAEAVTVSTSEFRAWYDLFYPNGKKTLSEAIFEDFDETSLVYWYLDDGSLSQLHYTIWFFDQIVWDSEKLTQKMRSRFDIDFSLQRSHTNGMSILYVPTSGTGKFTEILLRIAPACMRWKIHPWYLSVLGNQQPSLERNLKEGSTTTIKPKGFQTHGDKDRPASSNCVGTPDPLLG